MAVDLELVRRIADAAEEADGAAPLDEATWLALRNRPESVRSWVRDDGVALLVGEDLTLVVHPSVRGRGLGTELAAAAVPPSGPVEAWSHGDHPAAARLAERHGLARARELWVMRRPSSVPLPDLPVRDGVTVRSYEPTDAEAVVGVNAAAFAAHPEQGAMDLANLHERMAEPWFDPAGLLVAVDSASGELLGFHWTKQHSPTLGEVYVVGISPAAQGRGLGKLLTLAGLHHLVGQGVDEVLLYVDSDNVPAIAVYGGLGFEHAASDTHVQYRRG
ncbi:mycothiol synthase [Nocardioides marmotae]|uniref:mycothiol synthase n=1 Tax=Nocardioides marmotae TaxID=2663857 RepID=UPI0013232503|nr:mycothiol synthase [Nocardioides marmotae]MBC9735326.1 mycothiol synthase [Nocardioides marmotae]MTB86426.1 mycothiol synthase [Nocardioides marmotae]